ncbi:MAG: sporulation integral membrane protein YtvI [Acutalibacteraceae bacterium]|nr:sporulation integral membrane protein YtvI [Acutalibacteraceae bacterium]
MEQQSRKSFLINTFYFVTIAAIIFVFCKFMLVFLMPFVVGGAVAWLVQEPADFISSKLKIKHSIVAGTLALAVFAGIGALIFFICFKAVGAAVDFFGEIGANTDVLTSFFDNLKNSAASFFEKLPRKFTDLLSVFYGNAVNRLIASLTSVISSAAGYTVKHAPQFLLSCVVAAASSCYIAADYRKLIKFVRELCGDKIYRSALKIKNILVNSVFKFAKGYLIILVITFAELFLGFTVFRIRYALILAAIISVIDILPVLGTGTVLVPWAAAEFILGNTAKGAGLAVLYLIITAVRNFAEPKIIGKQMGIKPLFTLLAMFVGIKLFGIAGIFILPITIIVVIEYYREEE